MDTGRVDSERINLRSKLFKYHLIFIWLDHHHNVFITLFRFLLFLHWTSGFHLRHRCCGRDCGIAQTKPVIDLHYHALLKIRRLIVFHFSNNRFQKVLKKSVTI